MTEFGELMKTEDGSWAVRHMEHGQVLGHNANATIDAWLSFSSQ